MSGASHAARRLVGGPAPSHFEARALQHPGHAHAYVFMAALACGQVLLVVATREWLTTLPLTVVSAVALAVGLGSYLAVAWVTGGFWSLPALLFLVAGVFHLGLTPFTVVQARLPGLSISGTGWLYSQTTVEALALVAIGLSALAGGLILTSWRGLQGKPDVENAASEHGDLFGRVGFILTCCAVLLWYGLAVMSMGPLFIGQSYANFLNATSTLPLPTAYLLLDLGIVLVTASGSRKWVRRSMVPFIVFAAAALPIGLRGEVLFVAVTGAALVARWHKMPRARVALLIVLALLAGASAVKQLRQEGLAEASASSLQASPAAAVAELGSTLRVVSVVVAWHGYGQEPFMDGATYSAPIDRAWARMSDGYRPPAAMDYRLMNVQIADREGPIGGSFIAEAYHNFGAAGVVAVPLLFGMIVGASGSRPRTVARDALAGVFLVELLQHVRNSFTPFPAQVILGSIVVLVLVAIVRARRRRPTATSRRAGV